MRNLTKTLAVLTLAAGSLGLTQGALAGDRLTVIYTDGDHHSLPLVHWNYRPYSYWHHHADRYGHGHSYYRKPWRGHEHRHHDRHDRHRHEDRRSRHDYRDRDRDRDRDRHRRDGHYNSRVSHSAYERVSRN